MKGMLDYGSQVKRPWYIPRDEQTMCGLIGGISGFLVFLPALYISLLLWELLFFIPYYGNYLFLNALPLLYLIGIAAAYKAGISFGKTAKRLWPGPWGYWVGSAMGGVLAAALLASAFSGLSVLIEALI
jgi:hypothetical protein